MQNQEEETVNRKTVSILLVLMIVLTMVLAACGATPECPESTPCPECPEAPECPECPEAPAVTTGAIFDRVKERGKVICGSRTDLLGFGYLDENGKNVGFDIDLCRAVAAAMFNDPNAVEFVPLTAAERGPALQTGEVDMLSRNVTWTSSRDAQWGNFTIIMFYDGQGMMVRKDSGFTKLEDLDGATICVTTGTTTEKNLADNFRQRGLSYEAVTFEDTSAVYSAYEDGRCDAATSDKSQLAAVREGFANPDDHIILDVTMSKEPLTPAVPAGDDKWFDVVKTVMYVLINAEELGVTQDNVDEMMNSDNVQVRRLLGVEGSFGQEDLGLSQNFAANVIRAVGNYGEIYDRYMGPNGMAFSLPRSINELWTNGGLIYAPPLR
ncbi:MAG TPA: transporter substrate-binding domain-containing protein [Anaerolineae bacterium]|nr:transporter substrate-binding domain-containing protein [Anaerolineae bacterium]